MTVREDMQAGDSGLAAWARAISVEHNDDHDTIASGRLSESGLSATFVVFRDQNGNPLPPGSVTTIHVNTVTGEIDDITFEGV